MMMGTYPPSFLIYFIISSSFLDSLFLKKTHHWPDGVDLVDLIFRGQKKGGHATRMINKDFDSYDRQLRVDDPLMSLVSFYYVGKKMTGPS